MAPAATIHDVCEGGAGADTESVRGKEYSFCMPVSFEFMRHASHDVIVRRSSVETLTLGIQLCGFLKKRKRSRRKKRLL
jgi:hypothetical protein